MAKNNKLRGRSVLAILAAIVLIGAAFVSAGGSGYDSLNHSNTLPSSRRSNQPGVNKDGKSDKDNVSRADPSRPQADNSGDPDDINVDSEQSAPSTPANHTNPNYQSLPQCTVTRVSDGDTFYVDCLSQRIRLVGVDTPESTNKHQCYGNDASAHTKGLIGQRVYLETDSASGDVDTYGRPLRFVYLADGTNYNMQLIEDGYGMLYIFRGQQFNYRDKFTAVQEAAKSAGKGLWSACRTGINKYGNYQVTN